MTQPIRFQLTNPDPRAFLNQVANSFGRMSSLGFYAWVEETGDTGVFLNLLSVQQSIAAGAAVVTGTDINLAVKLAWLEILVATPEACGGMPADWIGYSVGQFRAFDGDAWEVWADLDYDRISMTEKERKRFRIAPTDPRASDRMPELEHVVAAAVRRI